MLMIITSTNLLKKEREEMDFSCVTLVVNESEFISKLSLNL